jgi:hypothetical protein
LLKRKKKKKGLISLILGAGHNGRIKDSGHALIEMK